VNVIAEEYPTDREIRETAVLLLAADIALCDSMDAWEALFMAKNIERTLMFDKEWSNGKHAGDCTKQPFTCHRCVIESMEDRARKMWDE
jgi:hypothetical protein